MKLNDTNKLDFGEYKDFLNSRKKVYIILNEFEHNF